LYQSRIEVAERQVVAARDIFEMRVDFQIVAGVFYFLGNFLQSRTNLRGGGSRGNGDFQWVTALTVSDEPVVGVVGEIDAH
jgi:hypothetical protein